jgi:hypothetical protein
MSSRSLQSDSTGSGPQSLIGAGVRDAFRTNAVTAATSWRRRRLSRLSRDAAGYAGWWSAETTARQLGGRDVHGLPGPVRARAWPSGSTPATGASTRGTVPHEGPSRPLPCPASSAFGRRRQRPQHGHRHRHQMLAKTRVEASSSGRPCRSAGAGIGASVASPPRGSRRGSQTSSAPLPRQTNPVETIDLRLQGGCRRTRWCPSRSTDAITAIG